MSFSEFQKSDRVRKQVDKSLTMPYGVSFLDDATGGIGPSEIVLLGARSGVGKTQLASRIARHAALSYKRVYYFALEAEDFEIERRLLFSELGRLYWQIPPHRKSLPLGTKLRYRDWRFGEYDKNEQITELEIQAAKNLEPLNTNIFFHYQPEGMSVPDFLGCLSQIKDDCELVILDHFHYFDWTEKNENEAIRNAVKAIRAKALSTKIPILLIAHLRKQDRGFPKEIPDIDDFYGSSDLSKIATTAILISRSKHLAESGLSATNFYIAKSRSAGDAVGFVGVVGFDSEQGSYADDYKLARNSFGEIETIKALPSWVKKGTLLTEEKEQKGGWDE